MRKYVVQITDKALTDMQEIYIYIAEKLLSPENAIGQYNRIANAIEGLTTFTERIKIMESQAELTMELRQMVVDSYFVFYVILDARIIVTRVLYSASDISSRLLDEK